MSSVCRFVRCSRRTTHAASRRNAIVTALPMLLTVSTLLGGCGGSDNIRSSSPAPNPSVSSTRQVGNLRLTMTADKTTYQPGERVNLTFTVTNTGTSPLPVSLTYSQFPTAFQIIRNTAPVFSTGAPVGQEPETPSPANTLTFAPGETKTYKTWWSQYYFENTQAPGGNYTASAGLLVTAINGVSQPESGSSLSTLPVTFSINNVCPQDDTTYEPGKVIISVKPEDDTSDLATQLSRYGTLEDPVKTAVIHFYILKLKPGGCVADAIRGLKQLPSIQSIDTVKIVY